MTHQASDTVVQVEQVSKRFCRALRQSMRHGLKDLVRCMLPGITHNDDLRNKEFWALKDISIAVKRGDVLGVLGVNGSGKTTLMRVIAGILPFERGRVAVHGRVVSLFALSSGIHPVYTGRENAYVRGALYGLNHDDVTAKMDQIIDFAELGDVIDSPVGIYSSGMRSRLAYAIALASEPDVMIVDESLAVGDIAFRNKCFQNIASLGDSRAIIFVSKLPAHIRRIANRAVVLHRGSVAHENSNVNEAIDYYEQQCVNAPFTCG
jgi:lipopolysaccharide transport system ATP-binding protein